MNKHKLQLFYFDACPFCQKVIMALKEYKVDYQKCNTKENPEFREKLKKETGTTMVPCLYIDDVPMHESSDIVQWIQTHYAK